MPNADDLADRRRSSRAWLAVAGWTLMGLIVAQILRLQNGLSLSHGLVSALGWYYSLGAAVWAACAIDRRLALWQRPLVGALARRVGIGAAAMVLWAIFIVAFSRLTVGPDFWRLVFGTWWMFQLLTTVMVYIAGVGIGLTVQAFDRERERQQRESRLELLAREAELTAIKAQLQPHFLFNALNSILALIDHDPAEARRMLTRLSSLLHSVFDRLDEPLSPLERELDTIRDYLEIERIRFGERLLFTIDIDAAARQVPVPPFLLQPIVENAVKHGIEPHARPGAVRISGVLEGGRLHLSVADTGAGNGAAGTSHGRGLSLTRRRLASVYGSGASIRSERGGGGYTVTIDLPAAADVA